MDSPEERVKIAATESDRLKEYLGSLPIEAWSKPSACDRWQVRDVVAHLAEVADAYIQRIHESLQIDVSTFDSQNAPGFISATLHADGNAQQAISRRERLGDQVFSDFVRSNDELIRLMNTFEPADWDRPHYYASLGTIPMRYRPDLWISELALHGWDVSSELELEAHFSDESLPVLLDVIPGQLTIFCFRPRPNLPVPIRYRWELTGVGARNTDIVVEADRATVNAAGAEKAAVIFRCDSETFLLIAYGRLALERASAENRLIVRGDSSLASEFQQSFALS